MAFTAVALEDAALITESEKDVLLSITILILERHVSGTWEQKKAALRVLRDRRDGAGTLKDFEGIATKCLRRFPVN
jgi:hypothetical protein